MAGRTGQERTFQARGAAYTKAGGTRAHVPLRSIMQFILLIRLERKDVEPQRERGGERASRAWIMKGLNPMLRKGRIFQHEWLM